MPSLTFYATSQAQQIWTGMASRGASTVLIVNNDPVNPVYVGQSHSVAPTASDAFPLGPLNTLSLPATQDIWIASAGPTVQVFGIPDGTNWSPSPAQVAVQINTLGLAKDSSVNALPGGIAGQFVAAPLFSSGPTALPDQTGGGADQPINPTAISNVNLTGSGLNGCDVSFFSGYEIVMQMTANAAATVGLVKVTVLWFNQITDTIPIDEMIWTVPANTGGAITIGRGFHRGNFMAIQIASQEGSGTAVTTLTKLSISGSLRQFVSDYWQSNGVSLIGTTSAAKAFTNQLIVVLAASIGAGVTVNRFGFLYAGRAHLFLENQSNVGTFVGALFSSTTPSGMLWEGAIPQNLTGANPVSVDLILPRQPVILNVTNNGAAGGSLNCTLIADRV